jgi:hypothetical protein
MKLLAVKQKLDCYEMLYMASLEVVFVNTLMNLRDT